jgi:nitrite reductase (NADH) large subunit
MRDHERTQMPDTGVKSLVVVGGGMVGHRLIEQLVAGDAARRWKITLLCEEPHRPYDRVHLSDYFDGGTGDRLFLAEAGLYERAGVDLRLAEPARAIDRERRCVQTAAGATLSYDALVLATGSRPFVPPIAGSEQRGCFVYRTLDDLAAIAAYAAGRTAGVVIGGGLLGLEACGALRKLRLQTHVVEQAPWLMPLQVDAAGGAILARRLHDLGVAVHTGTRTSEVLGSGVARGLRFADGAELAADLVVFSAGVRPRDELARACGLALADRGGVLVDDACRTSDPAIWAIGECAAVAGQCFGLVAPGYAMAEVVAEQLAGPGARRFTGPEPSTRLKLLGVDVASFGDSHARAAGSVGLAYVDERAGVYRKLVVSADGTRLLGGILVGDATGHDALLQVMRNQLPLPAEPAQLLLPTRTAGAALGSPESLPETAQICSCNDVSKGAICRALRDGLTAVAEVKKHTRAGTGCGGCVPLIEQLVKQELTARGVAVTDHLCEHFPCTRQELYHQVRVRRLRSFAEVLAACGRGHGCETCKPAIASILASCWNEHVLAPQHAPLQDSNDQFLANLQRDGSYSVVPRVPGGEITPEKLIAIGEIARRHDLYTKITGGQRIDLFGARVDQLPAIWEELIAAGFESGHAYGKALRTVKTCVGSTWCRYGVQDSVGLGIRLENRYKGLRAPHKIKMAVSGCARECAEAQSKDVGVIATEAGYNLYVAGNGGMRPRHAELLATDLDEETLVRYIDRFLMFYVRTADRLQRTARWVEALDGGLAYLRRVIIDDQLGICAQLEQEMASVIASYQCEWRAALASVEVRARFRTFVNCDDGDRDLVYVRERGQRRPARPGERAGASPAPPGAQR